MKTVISLFFLMLLPLYADAEIYRWVDDKGVVHVTDDMTKIPAKYWEQGRVEKEEVKPAAPEETRPVQPPAPLPVGEKKEERYGDQTLDWWIFQFKSLSKDINDTEEKLNNRKQYVSVYEGGLRFGKIFTKEEMSRYDSYKAEIPSLEEKLKELTDMREELRRKATLNGVPREIRE